MQSDAKDGEEKWANAIHAGGADGPVWDRMSADPFVQRELRDLSALETPYLGEVESVPIHAPEEIDGWGRPIGTVYVTGFSRLSRWLGSGSLIVFGLSFIAVGISAAFLPPNHNQRGPVEALYFILFGCLFTGIGIWQGFLSRKSLPGTLWIFAEGVLLQRGYEFRIAAWHEIESFETSWATARPLFWLTLEGERPIVLSGGSGPAVAPLMEFVELRASAAQLVPSLKAICLGEGMQFGELWLDKSGISGPGFFAPWSEVGRLHFGERYMNLDGARQTQSIPIRCKDISFPRLVLALSRILIARHNRMLLTDNIDGAFAEGDGR